VNALKKLFVNFFPAYKKEYRDKFLEEG